MGATFAPKVLAGSHTALRPKKSQPEKRGAGVVPPPLIPVLFLKKPGFGAEITGFFKKMRRDNLTAKKSAPDSGCYRRISTSLENPIENGLVYHFEP